MNNLFTKNNILFFGLTFLLCGISFYYVAIGNIPAFLFLAASGIIFSISVLFPKIGIMTSVVAMIFFERFFSQQPLVLNDAIIKFYPLDAVLLGVYLSIFTQAIRNRFRGISFSLPEWFLLAFFMHISLLFLVSVFFFDFSDIPVAFSMWKNYVFYGMIFFAISRIFSKKEDAMQLGKIFLYSTIVALLFLVIGVVRGNGLWTEYNPLSTSGSRLLGFRHALYFSLAFIMLFFFTTFRKNIVFDRFRFLATTFVPALFLIGIIGSLMRHLWIALLAALLAGFLFFSGESKSQMIRNIGTICGVFALVGVIGLSVLTLAPNSSLSRGAFEGVSSFFERVVSITDSGVDESAAWRGSVWRSAFSEFSEHPIFGVGLGENVPVELGDYRAIVEVRSIHNSWFAIAVQTGAIGSILFLFSFFLFIIQSLQLKLSVSSEEFLLRGILLSILVFFGIAFLFQPYLESNNLTFFFWITLGLIGALLHRNASSKKTFFSKTGNV